MHGPGPATAMARTLQNKPSPMPVAPHGAPPSSMAPAEKHRRKRHTRRCGGPRQGIGGDPQAHGSSSEALPMGSGVPWTVIMPANGRHNFSLPPRSGGLPGQSQESELGPKGRVVVCSSVEVDCGGDQDVANLFEINGGWRDARFGARGIPALVDGSAVAEKRCHGLRVIHTYVA